MDMPLEVTAQVGALVGTSLFLFIVTTPQKNSLKVRDEAGPLKGIMRYSSYHRKRHYYFAAFIDRARGTIRSE